MTENRVMVFELGSFSLVTNLEGESNEQFDLNEESLVVLDKVILIDSEKCDNFLLCQKFWEIEIGLHK